MGADEHPVLILGAGLTGSLTALALMEKRPDVEFLLIDQAPFCGGGPVLPFLLSSVPQANGWLIDPLIVRKWDGYYVAGPGFNKMAFGQTAFLVPAQIHAEIVEKIPARRCLLGTKVADADGRGALLADGRKLQASLVLDARGAKPLPDSATAWRQTTSRRLSFGEPHALERPILVDATFVESEWSFLQYYPLDPYSLLIHYIRTSHDGGVRAIDQDIANSEGGTLLEETTIMECLLEAPGAATAEEGDLIPIRSLQAEMWNPILSSTVSGATRIAEAIASPPILSPEALQASLGRLSARARDHRSRCSDLIHALCSTDSAIRCSAIASQFDDGVDGGTWSSGSNDRGR